MMAAFHVALNFVRKRSVSLSTVILVLYIILILQDGITYTTTFGNLDDFALRLKLGWIPNAGFVLRIILLVVVFGLWITNSRQRLFKMITVVNAFFTIGLLMNLLALVLVLVVVSANAIKTLLGDVILLVVSNILIFSIWYWIIDPPGVDESTRDDEPWDFLFPQRGESLPHYESWQPRYTDYLYIAFTTSFAFSPTDALPLTRRAKLLMLLQSTVSIVTLTAIAGSAINLMVGGG